MTKNFIGSIIHDVFSYKYKDGGYSISGENYEDINWHREDQKPSLEEVQQWVMDFRVNEKKYKYDVYRALEQPSDREILWAIFEHIAFNKPERLELVKQKWLEVEAKYPAPE